MKVSYINLESTMPTESIKKASNESISTVKLLPLNDLTFQKNEIQQTDFMGEMIDENGEPTEQAYQVAVNKLNEFMEYSQRNSKFIFHKDLERYYIEVVDAQTQEVVKEIPPKEMLDAYYKMQKLVGKMFDTQV